jgi:transposase InsO family protein
VDQQALVEYRYQAVREVLAGSPITQVAAQYGTSRQSLHTWRARFEADGKPGLADRSRRPRNSPSRLLPAVEALICELRQQHPRWGARRIVHEITTQQLLEAVPARATVHRVLVRNGLVAAEDQQHPRKYRRWQREAPMHLWQLDLVGGIPLADGRECKMVTGIDDHSRFIVIAAVVAVPSGRAVSAAFIAAMHRYGVPFEVLSDNGKQFTGRHHRPQPVEVMFEKVCRENGILQRLTKPRSPTTTGKIERWHKTLRRELLDHVAPFESLAAAQEAIDGWVHAYNHQRPHQSLDMATPASRFRPHGPARDLATTSSGPAATVPGQDRPVADPATESAADGVAVEFEARVPPSGTITVVSGKQQVDVHPALAGRTLTIWADQRSIHLVLDGHVLRTVSSRLRPGDLKFLSMRGARPAGPAPAGAALTRVNGKVHLGAGQAVEFDRKVHRDGHVLIAGGKTQVGFSLAGSTVVMRLDGHLMHAIANGALVGTWPCPLPADRIASLPGARIAATPLPPPPLPPGSIQAQRRVHANGRIMVNRQRIKLGQRHAGKLVTVVIEDTHYRILHDGEELAIRPRKDTTPITRLHVRGKGAHPD